ncbi:hypothetical protein, partial [Clostridium sp. AM27-28]|uniref:hypothetical protein n=1 Tax=Clostridium sp. AM27-28 TaxID=2293025 RepID=UPI001A9C01C7
AESRAAAQQKYLLMRQPQKLFSIICTYSQPIPDNLSVVSGHMDNDDLIIANRLIRKFTGTVMHSSQEKAVADDGIL